MVVFLNDTLDHFFHEQRERFILWVPVGIGVGILAYFSFTPFCHVSWFLIGGIGLLSAALTVLFSTFFKLRILLLGLFCISLGFMASHIRTLVATTPILNTSLEDPVWVRGTIVDISQGVNQKKLILSVEHIQKVIQNPKKIQLIYRAKREKEKVLHPGDFIELKAKLECLQGPLVPGGYDFRRQAVFKQIGAQGYVVYIHRVTHPQKNSFFALLDHYRLTLTQKFLKHLPGQEGAMAAALITGDTASLSKEVRTAFADSGTAHILAISGLHLSLIGGLLLALTRFLVGFCPPLILRIPAKKIAAVLALVGALGYLYLSGCRVPTQRAFISFGLMMLAILIDRNPLSMRLVAVAATCILLISPEVLFTPSFQLSFAAVVGLIAFYESVQIQTYNKSRIHKFLVYGVGILFSSVVASIATLPFTIYHFYKFTLQSISSNLLMIPLLSLWVMPLCLGFIGLSWWPLGEQVCVFFLGKGLALMIHIAEVFSNLPGSLLYLPGFSRAAFALTVFGGLILCLFTGKVRWNGVGLLVLAVGYTFLFPKPTPILFIAEGGKNIGIVHQNHLFLSSPRTDTFLATVWSGYVGIPPNHVHALKQKKAHPLMPPIIWQGKSFLVTLEDLTIGYEKTAEDVAWLREKSDVLVAPKGQIVKGEGAVPTFLVDEEIASHGSHIFYRHPNRMMRAR